MLLLELNQILTGATMSILIFPIQQLKSLFTNFVLFTTLAVSINFFANNTQNNEMANITIKRLKIQLATLLDTSSSMNGLIDQVRNQLWQVVNEFSNTTKDGQITKLEVAVYEYDNSWLSFSIGYIRQVIALSSDLDSASKALFFVIDKWW